MDTENKTKQLPYIFAKTKGVVCVHYESDNGAIVYHLPKITLQTIAEIKRVLQCPLHLKEIDQNEFQQHLS